MGKILFVGLEVDDKAFHAALVGADKEFFEFQCKPKPESLISKFKEFAERGYQLKICYEASYVGFSLCRGLRKEGFECDIVAPSLIPQTPGPRIKTDRLDSIKLAQYFQNGLLTLIHVPNEREEADRDVLRARAFLLTQVKATKLYLTSLCRRRGWNYRQESGKPTANYWTKEHRRWLLSTVHTSNCPSTQQTFRAMMKHLMEMEQQLVTMELEVEKMASSEPYQRKVHALSSFRGIQIITAMTLITELGDIKRFSHPKKLVSFVGMDLSEYSSGASQRRYHITKMGNVFVRTALIEAAQHVSLSPQIGRDLKRRRQQATPEFVEIADRCINRLHKRYYHLIHRGKSSNLAKVACAREMIGFVWEALNAVA